jgi:hypothetical protein
MIAAYRQLEESGRDTTFECLMLEIEDAVVKSLLVELDERATEIKRRDSAKYEVRIDSFTQLRNLVDRLHQPSIAQRQRQLEALLQQNSLTEEEEAAVRKQMIAAKRRQQGISAPTEG